MYRVVTKIVLGTRISYELLDMKTNKIEVFKEEQLINYLASKYKVANVKLAPKTNELVGTECSLNRLPVKNLTTGVKEDRVIILKVLKDKADIVGYVLYINNGICTKSKSDTLKLIQQYGLSNGKLVKKDDDYIISAIKGNFDVAHVKTTPQAPTSEETNAPDLTNVQYGKLTVAEIVTNKILEQLANNNVPWQKPWVGYGGAYSYITGKPYRGINVFLLGNSGEYITKKEFFKLKEKNPNIKMKKGIKWEIIVHWNIPKKATKTYDKTTYSDTEVDDNGQPKKIVTQVEVKAKPTMSYYSVAHISYFEGIPSKLPPIPKNDIKPERLAEEVIAAYVDKYNIPVRIVEGENHAYYSLSEHAVTLPHITQFKSSAEYYGAYFHELTHSCGKYLGRKISNSFGDDKYSHEELVAELGSCIIMSTIGLEPPINNSAMYIKGWSSKLKSDPNLFPVVAQQAQHAADFILKCSPKFSSMGDLTKVDELTEA